MCGRGVSIKCWVCWVALACSAMGVVVTGAEIERSASVSPVPADVQVAKVAGAKPRNVVFILSDDHRYDAMSFLGHQFAETPHFGHCQQLCLHWPVYQTLFHQTDPYSDLLV